MKRLSLIIPSLCFMLPLHADTNEAVSEVFSFDVRDTTGTTEAVSGVFGMDARNLGNSASSASGVFALGTQSGNLDALVIDASAPGSVIAGQAYAFPAKASFAGQGGSLTDVSTAAKWFIVGEAPAGTRFEGNKLIGGNVTVPTVIRVSAVFVFPSGAREAVPVEVTIHPATPGYKVVANYRIEWNGLLGVYKFFGSAATGSPQGAAAPQNVFWDLDQDGDFDDATGLQPEYNFTSAGTIRCGVRAEWSLGVGPPAIATNHFFVTIDHEAILNEPQVGRAVDVTNGGFVDSDGEAFVPAAANKANGLVVLAHGLWGSGNDDWLREMRSAVLTRLSTNAPNVAIYDWEKMSDPTEYRTSGSIEGVAQSGIRQFDDFVLIRPYGKSQGVIIADWIERQRMLGRVDRSAKIHLIGHSAGGFAMGETARLLNQRLYNQIQVTMLDTPVPYHEHIKPAWRTERYISSWFGGNPTIKLQADAWNLTRNKVETFTYKRPVWSYVLAGGLGGLVPGVVVLNPLVATGPKYYRTVINPYTEDSFEQHGAVHEYYTATIHSSFMVNSKWSNDVVGDGFNQSLLVNDADFTSSANQEAPAPKDDDPQPDPPYVPPMDDFSIFGDVQQTGSVYQVTEQANAGIFKAFTLPAAAATLQFQLQVTTPGDGDFVSVHWNDGDALAIIPETSLAYDAPLLHEIDITGLGGQTGTLTLKLNSRGTDNSVVVISEIRILENNDLDGDGLTNDLEQTAGSDPLEFDSDGDGLTDAEEVLTHGTSPLMTDTDHDGQGDSGELVAGTDPLDSQSRFVAAMGDVAPGDSATVWWNGVTGRNYRVIRSQELGTLNLDFLQSGVEGASGPMSHEDANAPEGRAFYWIEVE